MLTWEESNCAYWETDGNTRCEAGGVIRHQQHLRRTRQSAGEAAGVNRRQRTNTSRLILRHFNAHICSSANLTRISKVNIPNSNINFEAPKFEVRLTPVDEIFQVQNAEITLTMPTKGTVGHHKANISYGQPIHTIWTLALAILVIFHTHTQPHTPV